MERWSDGIIRPEPNADHIIEGSFHRTMTRLMSWPEATNLEVKRLLVASLSLTNFEVLGRIEIKIATNPQGEDLKIQGTKADLLVVLATLNQLFPMRRGFCLSEGREFDIIEMASIDLGYCPSCRAILNVQI